VQPTSQRIKVGVPLAPANSIAERQTEDGGKAGSAEEVPVEGAHQLYWVGVGGLGVRQDRGPSGPIHVSGGYPQPREDLKSSAQLG